jgi:hypothetical protein
MQVMSSDTIVALENEDGSRHLLLNGNETNFYLGRERNFKLALPFGLAVDGKLRGSAVSADTHVLLASTMTNHSVFLLVHSNVIAESFEWRKRK